MMLKDLVKTNISLVDKHQYIQLNIQQIYNKLIHKLSK